MPESQAQMISHAAMDDESQAAKKRKRLKNVKEQGVMANVAELEAQKPST